MRGYPRVQICEPTMWHTVLFEFWSIVLLVFSLGGHTDTYRTVCYGHGAFELCLPSLGIFLTKLTLRCLLLGQPHRMAKVWVGQGQPPLATLCRASLSNTSYIGY